MNLFYSSKTLANIADSDITGDLYAWQSDTNNKTFIKTSTSSATNLYFVIKTGWWTNKKTLNTTVGPVEVDSSNIRTSVSKNGTNYTVVYLGNLSGTSTYTVKV